MGYRIMEQTPWGAAEMVVLGPKLAPGGSPTLASSGNDASRTARMRPGPVLWRE